MEKQVNWTTRDGRRDREKKGGFMITKSGLDFVKERDGGWRLSPSWQMRFPCFIDDASYKIDGVIDGRVWYRCTEADISRAEYLAQRASAEDDRRMRHWEEQIYRAAASVDDDFLRERIKALQYERGPKGFVVDP
jgi:hypothetical protein